MFFWKRLFSAEYEKLLWRPSIKRVFPSKILRRSNVAAHLERIYQTRNRIAHHEPVYGYRLRDVLGAIDFVLSQLWAHEDCSARPLERLLQMERKTLGEQAEILQTSIVTLPGRHKLLSSWIAGANTYSG